MTDDRKAASNADVESAAGVGLLPCPFCGKPPEAIETDFTWSIGCNTDDCLGPAVHSGTEAEAIDLWNRRAPQAQGDGVAEALAKAECDLAPAVGDDYKSDVLFRDGETIANARKAMRAAIAALAPKEAAPAADMGRSAIDVAMAGYQKWAEKPHNAKWVRKIDGTPIPNDLPVCIANEFAALAPAHSSSEPSREPEAYLIENVMVPTAPFAPRDTTLTDRDWLYPARRASDAHEAAKMLHGDLIPLYRSKDANALPFLPAQAAEPVAVKVKPLEWREKNRVWYAHHYEIKLDRAGHPFLYIGSGWKGVGTNPHLSLEAAQAAAQADHDAYIRSALSGAAPQAGEDEAERSMSLMEAAVSGWNACRRSIYAVCEDVDAEADRIPDEGIEHAKGYKVGMKRAAKSIARGFRSMEARNDDNFQTLFPSQPADAPPVAAPPVEGWRPFTAEDARYFPLPNGSRVEVQYSDPAYGDRGQSIWIVGSLQWKSHAAAGSIVRWRLPTQPDSQGGEDAA